MPQDSTSYRQMELGSGRGGMERLSPEQMRAQMEEARRQAEYYESQRVQWEKQQAELKENTEMRQDFLKALNDLGMRLHNATLRIGTELKSLDSERAAIGQIYSCLDRHLEILSSLQPQNCPPEQFPQLLAEALPKIERAENDFNEAYFGAENFRHTNILRDKPGEPHKSEFNWSILKVELAKGLAFHLPLFLLLLLTWLIYLAAVTF